MKAMENPLESQPKSRIEQTPNGIAVYGETYSLQFLPDNPYVKFFDDMQQCWTELSLCTSIDTIESPDATLSYEPPVYEHDADGTTVVHIASTSTAWDSKELVLNCRADSVELYVVVVGSGRLADCHLLGGEMTNGNRTGFFPSKLCFKSIFNPQPDITERRDIPASESTTISTHGMWLPGRVREFAVPTQWCYGASMQPTDADGTLTRGERLMMGIAAPIDQQNFTELNYDAESNGFSMALAYEGQTKIDGVFRTPSLLLHFAADPYKGLVDYATHAQEIGSLQPLAPPTRHAWHRNPMFCSWGEQTDLADKRAAQPTKKTAQDFSTQADYDAMLQHLHRHDISPPTIVIDDKWQQQYGTNTPDQQKWPDMQRWIALQHEIGRKVLLWWRLGAFEGVDNDLCIVDRAGRPVATDPSHPAFRALLRSQVRHLLSPEGLDADGLKVDFLAQCPTGSTLQKHGSLWGAAALHAQLKTLYTAAKQTKPDSLIINHAPSPWFLDTADMIRLNDINSHADIKTSMRHRQKVAQAAGTNFTTSSVLIDSDNWPFDNIEQWRSYGDIQSQIGVVALYNARGIGNDLFTERDYEHIRRSGFAITKE